MRVKGTPPLRGLDKAFSFVCIGVVRWRLAVRCDGVNRRLLNDDKRQDGNTCAFRSLSWGISNAFCAAPTYYLALSYGRRFSPLPFLPFLFICDGNRRRPFDLLAISGEDIARVARPCFILVVVISLVKCEKFLNPLRKEHEREQSNAG